MPTTFLFAPMGTGSYCYLVITFHTLKTWSYALCAVRVRTAPSEVREDIVAVIGEIPRAAIFNLFHLVALIN